MSAIPFGDTVTNATIATKAGEFLRRSMGTRAAGTIDFRHCCRAMRDGGKGADSDILGRSGGKRKIRPAAPFESAAGALI